MSELWGYCDALWRALATGVLHGTALALITYVLARTVMRGARPALMAALWTIVLLKFLVPVGPEVPLSLHGLVGELAGVSGESAAHALAVAGADASATAAPSRLDVLWIATQRALMLLYLALVAVLLARLIMRERRCRRWVARLPAADPALRAVVADAARKVGLARVPRVHASPTLAAPQIVGLWRPALLVPADLAAQTAILEATALHELAHLRRGDTWLRGLQLVAATLFFFWPVVRWVNRRIDEHREMACDQWALAWGALRPSEYARALVAIARRVQERGAHQPGLGLAMVRGRKQLHARVDALLGGRIRPRLGPASGAGLALWALVSLGSARGAGAGMPAEPPECVIGPGIVEYILATYPEADADGDGELSRDEVCAHQRRLKESGVADEPGQRRAGALADELLLASLDEGWLECAACGCVPDAPGQDSAPGPLDKRICSND